MNDFDETGLTISEDYLKQGLWTEFVHLETPQNKNDFSGSKTLRSVIRLHAYGYFLQEICSLISYHDLPKRWNMAQFQKYML
jgi:hypothetical protein